MTAYRAAMAHIKTRFLAVADLDCDCQAAAPNGKWVAGFTYAYTAEVWLFLAVVVDLFIRWGVGWSMRPSMIAMGTRRIGHGA